MIILVEWLMTFYKYILQLFDLRLYQPALMLIIWDLHL